MRVPFLNLGLPHRALREEILAAVGRVLDANAFAGGPFVETFEREFAAFCGTPFASGVGHGTDALWFALQAVGVRPGDEVVTVPSTFLATAEAITACGATPVFVDIDPVTYTMDPDLLQAALTPRTRAIVPVHLFGQVADMDPILALARRHGVPVVEDACQAHGALYRGRLAGSLADIGCFSFYPGKNLGAIGEAGAIVTANPEYKRRIDTLRDHGQARKYHHSVVGWNGRMDGIQAAVLSLKLPLLARGNDLRRAHAAAYSRLLAGVEGLTLPVVASDRVSVFHVYAVRSPRRDDLIQHLAGRGIGSGIHYPVPVHLQEAYRSLGHAPGSFPVAERCASEFVSLPMFPELTPDQIELVASELRAWAESALLLA